VLDILTEVSVHPRGSTAGEIARKVDVTAPTAHRLLKVLCDRDFAVQNESGKYVRGPQLRVLAGDGIDHATLNDISRPLLARLRDEASETVFLAVREGLQLTYLVVMTSSHSVQMYGERGQQIPLHATSQGKVILAFLPPGAGHHHLFGGTA
jgi:IclR family transcriptional regulator, acetate operon repressor